MHIYTMYAICIHRGAATGWTGRMCPSPTFKSRDLHMYWPPPPTFTTTFICIGWSPLHTTSFQRPYIYIIIVLTINLTSYNNYNCKQVYNCILYLYTRLLHNSRSTCLPLTIYCIHHIL